MPKKGYKQTEEHRRNLGKIHKGQIPWNLGLTKETDKRVKLNGNKISKSKKGKGTGSKNGMWKGGRIERKNNGYVSILRPNHPGCNQHGYVYEHRLVIEKHLGRYLKPEEVVHHINEKRDDNRIENLQLMLRSKHNRMHRYKHLLSIRKNKRLEK